MIPLVEQKTHKKWIQRFDDLMKIEVKEVIDKDLRPNKEGLSMGEAIVSINKHTQGDAVIVTRD
jgi:acetolactate synthase-1/2/3 large subunit